MKAYEKNNFRLSLPLNNHLRIELGAAKTLDQFKNIINKIKCLYEPYHRGEKIWEFTVEPETYNLALPPWLCQAYVRDTPANHVKKVEDKIKEAEKRLVINSLIYGIDIFVGDLSYASLSYFII